MEDTWVLRIPWSAGKSADVEHLLNCEWIVTNGLGGYASGTLAGLATRRYHGLLIAAHPAPYGRRMTLNHLTELVRLPSGKSSLFGGRELVSRTLELQGMDYLTEFRLEAGLPVWRFEVEGVIFEKRVFMLHQQNTVHIRYQLVQGKGPVRLKLRPSLHFRGHDDPVSQPLPTAYTITVRGQRVEISDDQTPIPMRIMLFGQNPAFTIDEQRLVETLYRTEESRGYDSQGELWSPGYLRVDLDRGKEAVLVASTESWDTALALAPDEALSSEQMRRDRLVSMAHPEAQKGPARQLILAADQFIINPVGRTEEAARARAAGDDVRSVIAGYHWFTDWGRDTMISLEGLTLTTGRHNEAGQIIRTFSHAIRDGLLPNLFPEGAEQGLYHTADATMWFFHAIDRYVDITRDRDTLRFLLPKLESIVEHHLKGTRFNIRVDPKDDLLHQGEAGYQLTWMDAKVGDWVVTPRRGKAVEINALWYNALRLMEEWHAGTDQAKFYSGHAERIRASFNRRFWYEKEGYLYDVVDGEQGDDASCRPNQVLAISLKYPVLQESRWRQTLGVVRQRLLTPVGLRSLAPGHRDYKSKYFGDLRARDAAYHQGTVWGWLIGPFIDAWLRVYPDQRDEARSFLNGLIEHLSDACIGSISEVFDADPPYAPRGCIAQAWSVAEALRVWVKTR